VIVLLFLLKIATQVAGAVLLVFALMACVSASEAHEPAPVAGLTPTFNRHLMQGNPKITWDSKDCTKVTFTGKKNPKTGGPIYTCPKGRISACCSVSNRCVRNVDGDGVRCTRDISASPACCPWDGL
jgi:hypothetical protein